MTFLKNHARLLASSALLLALLLWLMPDAIAAGLGGAPGGVPGASVGGGGASPEGAVTTVASLMQRIADGMAALAAAVAILFVVINGARITFSFGSTEELGKAKKGLIWAAAGLVLIIFAYIIAKSVIALVYSGADGSSAVGTAYINAPAAPSFFPVAGEKNPDGRCKQIGPLPDPCYGGTTLSQQSKTGGETCDEDAAAALTGVCSDLKVTDCTIKNLQETIDYDGLSVPASCTQADGKYGQCTYKALQQMYKIRCIK